MKSEMKGRCVSGSKTPLGGMYSYTSTWYSELLSNQSYIHLFFVCLVVIYNNYVLTLSAVNIMVE